MRAQAAEGGGEPAPAEQTAEEMIAAAEHDFFDFISKEQRRAARESNVLRVSWQISLIRIQQHGDENVTQIELL